MVKQRVRRRSAMAAPEDEVVKIVDSSNEKGTPLRPIFCLKNRDDIKKFDEREDCFILEFDPYDDLGIKKISFGKDFDDADGDLRVVSEKGEVACRDFPHPRYTCANFPFHKTSHEDCCDLCYCYVCDSAAPCKKWVGSGGHCHAFNNEAWKKAKMETIGGTKNM
ncbi:RPM1 interacting protein 13-like [Andrographis paniculata]|uniref:RPM1 interacting protein 13-like n=1 Tax=Andrographis paniculata TaxID=175694 RepID=UPI0021E70BC1|nr:RPM1 interacting protein 13-like [Andrographis paniculata]